MRDEHPDYYDDVDDEDIEYDGPYDDEIGDEEQADMDSAAEDRYFK